MKAVFLIGTPRYCSKVRRSVSLSTQVRLATNSDPLVAVSTVAWFLEYQSICVQLDQLAFCLPQGKADGGIFSYRRRHVAATYWEKCWCNFSIERRQDQVRCEVNPRDFLLSVDGVHFCIHEPRCKPRARWSSFKFESAGLAYEIALSTFESKIVWISGPYESVAHDKEIYLQNLKTKIPPGKVIADRGYSGPEPGTKTLSIRNDLNSPKLRKFKRRVRARHENFNARIKVFNVLNSAFRWKKNRLAKHKAAFEAVCVLVRFDIEIDSPLFSV